MKQSEKIDQLAAALIRVQQELNPVLKNAENPFFKSRYANLAGVSAEIQRVLPKHGLGTIQTGGETQQGVPTLETILVHSSGQFISGSMPLVCAKQNDPQALGSSITYLRRYGLAAIVGLVSEEDDDGNAASSRGTIDNKMASHSSLGNQPIKPKEDIELFDKITETKLAIKSGLIPERIREIGGKRYEDFSLEELEKHSAMIQKAYTNNKWPLKGDVLDFVNTVKEMRK